jgi:hypothetical protein
MLSVKTRTKRPFLVTLLAVVVLLLAMVNGGRTTIALTRWTALGALDLSIPLWLVAISGAVWGAIWLVEAWGLWRLWPPARPAGITLFIVYPIHMLAMQAAFTRGAYEFGLLPSMAITSALAAGLVALILTWPGIRTRFEHPVEEPEEHDC